MEEEEADEKVTEKRLQFHRRDPTPLLSAVS